MPAEGGSTRDEEMLKSIPEANPKDASQENMESIRTLFESEESPLLRFAFSLTGRRAVAEEIVQEVFLQLHAKWVDVAEPRAWLFRSVRNRAFHYLRKSRRETLGAEADPKLVAEAMDDLPEDLMVKMETVSQLRQLISRLPEKDRRLVQLKYFENLKYREISQQTGLTVTNVGYRLHQILKKLSVGLLPKGSDDES